MRLGGHSGYRRWEMIGMSWTEEEEGKEEMQGGYHLGRCVGKERGKVPEISRLLDLLMKALSKNVHDSLMLLQLDFGVFRSGTCGTDMVGPGSQYLHAPCFK